MKTQFYTASDEIKSNVFVVKQSSKERPMAGLGPDSGAKGSSLFQVGGGGSPYHIFAYLPSSSLV